MQRETVLGSSISIGAYEEFISEIFYLVSSKTPSYVCFANVHMAMEAHSDKRFQDIVNNANVVAPDGKPISLFLNLFKNQKQERVCGMDIFPDLLKRAEEEKKSVYFLGSTNELLSIIIKKASKDFPNLKINGAYSPPFRPLSKEEEEEMILQIKKSKPDLVFVSLGCPKQEKWMAENRDKIGACLLGVGQAFTVYAGVEKRLPKWMRDLSLEWIYRLLHEPGRLWKRYLITNSLFLYLTFNYLLLKFIHSISHLIFISKTANRNLEHQGNK